MRQAKKASAQSTKRETAPSNQKREEIRALTRKVPGQMMNGAAGSFPLRQRIVLPIGRNDIGVSWIGAECRELFGQSIPLCSGRPLDGLSERV